VGTNVFFRRYIKSVLRLAACCEEKNVGTLPGGRTLVLSPHYDDEVIGAGGAIMIQAEKGSRVGVVYLTDGRMGIPGIRDRSLVEATRRAESARALDILGIDEVYHMAEPETKLRPGRKLLRELAPIVKEFSPEVVFVPWFFDNHVDHVEANRVLASVAGELNSGVLIAGYEVWTPLVPNLYLDITGVASRKRKALLCFTSQLRQVDYMRTAMALGKRRAMEWGRGLYAEAFFCLRVEEYLDWIDRSGIGAMKFV